jgi:hypothetical protein
VRSCMERVAVAVAAMVAAAVLDVQMREGDSLVPAAGRRNRQALSWPTFPKPTSLPSTVSQPSGSEVGDRQRADQTTWSPAALRRCGKNAASHVAAVAPTTPPLEDL